MYRKMRAGFKPFMGKGVLTARTVRPSTETLVAQGVL